MTENMAIVSISVSVIFALVVNAVYFAYQHGKLVQQVSDQGDRLNHHTEQIDRLTVGKNCGPEDGG